MLNRTYIIAAGFFAVVILSPARAGPLGPPVGPIAPTPGPEPRIPISSVTTPGDADSLFKITEPGSYYLTGNITGVVGKHGIEIVVGGVTLDLNGFDLAGVPGMGGFDGVSVTTTANLSDFSISNGTIRGWGDCGIDLRAWLTFNCRIDRIRASGNANEGINTNTGATITGCSAHANANAGIRAGSGSVVQHCTATRNAGDGFVVSSGCVISHCASYDNTLSGFSIFAGSTITDCSARLNSANGIECTSLCLVRGNNCSDNGNFGDGAGIHATSSNNRIEGNACTENDRGVDVDGASNVVIRNTCSDNGTNWTIAANNLVGPIIDRTVAASGAISGDAAASTLGSTDANANYSH